MAKRRNYRQRARNTYNSGRNYVRRSYGYVRRKTSFFKKYKTILVTALIGLVVYLFRDKVKALFPFLNK